MYKERKVLLDLYVHMAYVKYIKHRSHYNKRKRSKIVISTIHDNSQQKNVKYESHLKTSRFNREVTVNSY